MQIKLDPKFEKNFNQIFEYIAQDKLSASKQFKNKLFQQIKNIPNHPYKYRQSFYFENEAIRDMVFNGYTVVYEVDFNNNCIVILNIFNKNNPI